MKHRIVQPRMSFIMYGTLCHSHSYATTPPNRNGAIMKTDVEQSQQLHLKAVLDNLGTTAAEVRTNLRQLGFIAMADKLGRLSALAPKQRKLLPDYISRSCTCPVALYVRAAMLGCTYAGVCSDHVTTRFLMSGAETTTVTPPVPVQEFIKADDARLTKLVAADA